MLPTFARRLLLAFSVASLVACGGSDDPAPTPEPDVEPKLSDIQAKIITPRCATSGCHDGTATDNKLDLRSGTTHKATVNIGAEKVANGILVKPNDPDNSVLYLLLSGPLDDANKMPKSGNVSAKQKEAIRLWIANGAAND